MIIKYVEDFKKKQKQLHYSDFFYKTHSSFLILFFSFHS